MRTIGALAVALALSACSSAAAQAPPSVHFSAALTPKWPGKRTTATFNIAIAGADGTIPPPLVSASVRYPTGLGLALSGLGIDTCSRRTIETRGLSQCPADSFMGRGSAMAVMAFGPEVIEEGAHVTLVRGPEEGEEGQLKLLFLVSAEEPVYAQPLMTGEIATAPAPYGGQISVSVPLVPTVPDGADVSLSRLNLVVGPAGLRYYEFTRGKRVPYFPRGLRLPDACPRGGYPFGLELTFLDGSRVRVETSVPCVRH